jgi:hypothetical protein
MVVRGLPFFSTWMAGCLCLSLSLNLIHVPQASALCDVLFSKRSLASSKEVSSKERRAFQKAEVEKLFNQHQMELSGSHLFFSKLYKRFLTNRALRKCASSGVCRADQVEEIFFNELETLSSKTKKIKNRVILGSVFVSIVALLNSVRNSPESLEWATIVIAAFGGGLMTAAMAPFLLPLTSRFQKWSFVQLNSGKISEAGEQHTLLENLWHVMQRTYSVNSQMSRNIISQYMILALPLWKEARDAVRSHQDYKEAAKPLAISLINLEALFRDIHSYPTIEESFRTLFSDTRVVDKEVLKTRTLELLKTHNNVESSTRLEFFERELDKWLDFR